MISTGDAASKVIFQTYQVDGNTNWDTIIVAKDPKQSKVATLERVMAYGDDGRIEDITSHVKNGRIRWKAPKDGWKVIAVFNGKTLQKVKRSSPGGEGWVMDPFSTSALDGYLSVFTKAFDRAKSASPNAFFDDSYEIYGADWTPQFFEKFKEKTGYDLDRYLPALLGQGNRDTVVRVIADYRQTLSDLLLDGFAKNWNEWAHKMNSRTRFQAHGAPGNLLDLYAAADIPEIESFGSNHFNIPGLPEDSLGDRPGKLDVLLLKFASSAAHVTGKPMTSSETFTWLGDHFRVALSQCKPLLDEMLLSGVNRVVFQGSPYSPKRTAWPGWRFYASVNFTPYNTFWKDIPAFNRYIGQTQAFLQEGKPDNDVLLYWPAADVWAMNAPTLLNQLTIHNAAQWLSPTSFHKVGEELTDLGYGIDYISDLQLQKVAVRNGALQTGGVDYKVLVVPLSKYMSEETMQKIVDLIKSGAKVIFTDELPQTVPGLQNWKTRDARLQELKKQIDTDMPHSDFNEKRLGEGQVFLGQDLQQMMFRTGTLPSGFSDAGLQYIRRKDADGYIYFVSNIDNKPVNQWVALAKKLTSAVLYDTYSGTAGKARLKENRAWKGMSPTSSVYLQLEPGQSVVIKGYTEKNVSGAGWEYAIPSGNAIPLKGNWTLSFEEGSPVIRDTYTLNGAGDWTGLSDSARVFTGTAKYKLTFDIPENIQAEDWQLDLGEVNFSADVTVNGQHVASLWAVPFRQNIGKYLKKGQNILEVSVTNIGANRIADYDRRGVKWKIFKDINVVNMDYKPFDASSWATVPSGLIGPVTMTPLQTKENF